MSLIARQREKAMIIILQGEQNALAARVLSPVLDVD